MCQADDSHLTLRFDDHFLIRPSITFTELTNDYFRNTLVEEGVAVEQGFEYNSGGNDHFLDIEEIRRFNQLSGHG
jgi:UDP-N-acetylglucosamine 4,6-dehydratase/5-epimerase